MTKLSSEQQIQNLYEQRKVGTKAPEGIQQQVMNYAIKKNKNIWRWLNWQSAVAMLCVVIIGSHLRQHELTAAPHYTVTATTNGNHELVYYHDVEIVYDNVESQQLKETNEYNQYLASLTQLQDSKQLKGVITNYDSSLTIEVCQLGKVQLSEQILQQLKPNLNINHAIQGQAIILLANNNGQVTGLELLDTQQHCPS